MKLPKAVLGAVLVGLTAQATSCVKKDDPKPKEKEEASKGEKGSETPANCPACGMG